MKYQILFNAMTNDKLIAYLCDAKDAKGRYWCFTATEEQAKDRVASLKEVDIDAWYEEIDNNHWINDGWIG